MGSNQVTAPTEKTHDDSKFNFNLYVENDTKGLGGAGGDNNYTNGIRLSFLYAEHKVPHWITGFPSVSRFFKDHPFNFGAGIGQQLFTPEDLSSRDRISNDRPYAGWLYVSPVLIVKNPESVETFELDLGIVGPSALGEPTQRNVHKFIHVDEPEGWNHQLRDELGVVLSYQKKYQIWSARKNQQWKMFDTIPYFGWGLGNVFTGVNGGIIFRFGYNIPGDYGPVRPSSGDADSFIRTTDPTPNQKTRNWSFYTFCGAKGAGVLHNIFLDGNTFDNSPRVTRVPLVADYEAGFFVQYKNVGLTWRQVTRTPEFYERFKPHSFGSASITYGQRY